MHLFKKQKQIHVDIETNLWLPKGRRDELGVGINRYVLLYINQINNKDLLYNTGNSIQYVVITFNGKEYEKEYVYIIITESLCCVSETNTIL